MLAGTPLQSPPLLPHLGQASKFLTIAPSFAPHTSGNKTQQFRPATSPELGLAWLLCLLHNHHTIDPFCPNLHPSLHDLQGDV